ncbi:MAG: hypothetical protein U1F77_20435 [Kiritimatiellia bacterium]
MQKLHTTFPSFGPQGVTTDFQYRQLLLCLRPAFDSPYCNGASGSSSPSAFSTTGAVATGAGFAGDVAAAFSSAPVANPASSISASTILRTIFILFMGLTIRSPAAAASRLHLPRR